MPHYSHISAKGQLVIPSQLRQEMDLTTGTKVAIQREGETLILRPITPDFIKSLRGCTKGAGEDREKAHRDDEQR